MASRFVSFILGRIRNLMISIQKNSNLMSLAHSSSSSSSNQANSFLEDLKELETLLPKIRAEMKAAEESELRGGFDKLWMAELKDVAYDAEDVLDEYQYEVLRLQLDAGVAPPETAQEKESGEDEVPVLPFASSFMTEVSISDGLRKRIKEKIKKIKAKYDEISRDRDRLQLPVEIFEDKEEHGSFLKKRRVDGTTKYRQTTSLVVKSDVYGRDSEKIELIEWLFSSSTSKFSVVAIVGQGGLGKTTLAQLVYNDDRVSINFDLQIWICVSDNFNVARLTKEMLEFNSMESCVLSDLSQLQHNLKIKLKGKKLLLVLDDVWNENPTLWESFIEPLRVACVVRVIVTTRNITVAKIMQTEEPHHLRPLSESDCWQLFQYHAFFGRDPYQFSYLVDIGKMIVKKCGGLPLAVKSIGGLLQHENTSEESWTDVLQSELWDLDEKEQILPALKLSYSRMPGYLRPCFQCCSMFPKYYPLSKKKLVRLWMAQGYIETVDERTMEELGSEYFDELRHRSFVGHYEYGGFKMHDSIHDLALHISGIENQSVAGLGKCDDLDRVAQIIRSAAKPTGVDYKLSTTERVAMGNRKPCQLAALKN
ncbi:disease resistance protein RGA1 isoform X1 [Canna indica]|uniref:Disease resistance protein RGA1 isoform X1 n=1 Tax=Canna indica TaxID=4628 RepID=A0AAQ3Q270_9LILI|nr:disease resistance protein RGA1 isoform X1 [Canna indica]